MFRRKEEVYSIKEFMGTRASNSEKEKKTFIETGVLIPLAVAPFLKVKAAMAATSIPAIATTGTMYDKMLHAFDPLIDIIQALSYPVAMIVVLGGALFIMIGNKEKGFSMMQ